MTEHLIDTDIKLGICIRCNAYVFTCLVGGGKVAVNPAELDDAGVRDALIAGRVVYDMLTKSGKPWILRDRTIDSDYPSRHKILGAHACGVHVREIDTTAAAAGKEAARANWATTQRSGARATHANNATRHRSDDDTRYLYRRCDKCADWIGTDKNIVGLKVGQYWEHVEHADCDGKPKRDHCRNCGRLDVTRQKDGTWFRHRDCSGDHWCGDEMSDDE